MITGFTSVIRILKLQDVFIIPDPQQLRSQGEVTNRRLLKHRRPRLDLALTVGGDGGEVVVLTPIGDVLAKGAREVLLQGKDGTVELGLELDLAREAGGVGDVGTVEISVVGEGEIFEAAGDLELLDGVEVYVDEAAVAVVEIGAVRVAALGPHGGPTVAHAGAVDDVVEVRVVLGSEAEEVGMAVEADDGDGHPQGLLGGALDLAVLGEDVGHAADDGLFGECAVTTLLTLVELVAHELRLLERLEVVGFVGHEPAALLLGFGELFDLVVEMGHDTVIAEGGASRSSNAGT